MDPIATPATGENWLKLSMTPHKKGLLVEVKAHPLIEDFIRSLGSGKTQSLEENIGRGRTGWTVTDPEAGPIAVWHMGQNLELPPGEREQFYLNLPGYGLLYDNIINLSFLRIAGISNGVSFISERDVYPIAFRRELKRRIGDAFRRFCMDYIKPVKITLVMTGLEG